MSHYTQIRDKYVPAVVLQAAVAGQLHKVAACRLGIEELTLEKIAQHIGQKMAERRQRWRPVAEGILALRKLRG